MAVTLASTISASFAGLASNLEISALQSATTSTRQQEVRSAMESGFTVLDSFLTGSYAKSTMIAPLAEADIDVFVVLSADYYTRYTPSGLLTEVRRVLRQRYPQTPEISPDGRGRLEDAWLVNQRSDFGPKGLRRSCFRSGWRNLSGLN